MTVTKYKCTYKNYEKNKKVILYTSHRSRNTFQNEENSGNKFELYERLHIDIYTDAFIRSVSVHKKLQICNF